MVRLRLCPRAFPFPLSKNLQSTMVRLRRQLRGRLDAHQRGFTIHYGEIKTMRRASAAPPRADLQSTMVRLRHMALITFGFNPEIYNPLW